MDETRPLLEQQTENRDRQKDIRSQPEDPIAVYSGKSMCPIRSQVKPAS